MISVCVATYNGASFIREQVLSILACISECDEVIISDDGSTDGTLEIIGSLASTHPNLRVVDGPHRGLIANFSSVLSLAAGDVVFLSDQDDVWHLNKVDRVMNGFANGDYGVVVHNARIVDASGTPTGQTLFEFRGSCPGVLKNVIKNSYVGCCMALRRDLLPAALPIPEDIEMHDWWIGLVCELVSHACFIDDVVMDYRRHESNSSSMSHHPLPKMIMTRVTLIRALHRRLGDLREANFL